MKKKFNDKLDKEEQELLNSFEKGEWKRSKNFKKDIMLAKEAARNYLRKDSRINIRLSSSDLLRLKRIAANEGLPYQTLVSSILHKYVAGHLHNNQNAG